MSEMPGLQVCWRVRQEPVYPWERASDDHLNKSGFIVKHQVEKHNSEPAEFDWKEHQGELLNSKAEFHQPPLVQVRSEIVSEGNRLGRVSVTS